MQGSASTPLVVLLASVLKPVDDTRMHGKFAQTLRGRPHTKVHIAGRHAAGAQPPPNSGVTHHPIFNGSRLSMARLLAQWRYWRVLQRVRPAVVVVHAPELLPLTLLWQALGRRRRFLYDIRENYALNISTQGVYSGTAGRWLSAGLVWVETWAARHASALVLAEASYAEELPYLAGLPANRVVVLENKYQPAPDEQLPRQARQLPAPTQALQLLYSGTISTLNGVWEAIAVAERLHPHWPGGAVLTIIGYCQQPAVLQELLALLAQRPGKLSLVGGNRPVPHTAIAAAIQRSHVGLLAYRPHPSTERCRPTKLFEYLAHGLPVLAATNPLWEQLLSVHNAGVAVHFQSPPDGAALVALLRAQSFYPLGIPTDVLWEAEGKKLWRLLDSLD